MNVCVLAVKVFIVVLITCCHSDNFMMRNETLVYCLLLLIICCYSHNVIHSFQQNKAVQMEQTSDGTILKSPFADQVMESSWSHPLLINFFISYQISLLCVETIWCCKLIIISVLCVSWNFTVWMVESCFMNDKCIIIIDPVLYCFKLWVIQIIERGRIAMWQ